MARNEKLYEGPAEVNGDTFDQVELWVASPEAVAAIIHTDTGINSVPIVRPTIDFVDEALNVVSEDGASTFKALRQRTARGSWLSQTVTDVNGVEVFKDVTVVWSDQGVTIIEADGTRTEMAGASTLVRYGAKSIQTWSMDPAEALNVVSVRRGCGSCGGGRR